MPLASCWLNFVSPPDFVLFSLGRCHNCCHRRRPLSSSGVEREHQLDLEVIISFFPCYRFSLPLHSMFIEIENRVRKV